MLLTLEKPKLPLKLFGGTRKLHKPHAIAHLDRAVGTGVSALWTFVRDNRFQILAFPSLLPSITIGCIICGVCDCFCLVNSSFFDVTSIHIHIVAATRRTRTRREMVKL